MKKRAAGYCGTLSVYQPYGATPQVKGMLVAERTIGWSYAVPIMEGF